MIIETTSQWRADKGRKLVDLINGDLASRHDWEQYRLEARRLYYGDGVQRPDITFEGATDINLPVVFENIERLTPKMNQAIWGADPHVIVDRVPEEFDPEDTRLQESYMNWAMDFDIDGLFITTHAWFRNMLLDGVGVVKTQWVTTWRNTCEVHRLKTHYRRGEVSAVGMTMQEDSEKKVVDLLDELFGSGQWTPHREDPDGSIHLTLIEGRRVVENVRMVLSGKSQFIDEVEMLVYRPVLVKDAPTVEIVEADNLIVPYRTRDLQHAKRVTHKHWMTVDEIRDEAAPDKFDPWTLEEGDYDRLLAAAAGSVGTQRDEFDNAAFGRQRDEVEGTIPNISEDPQNNQLVIYEVYLLEDIDGDGRREDIVLQVSPDLHKVLHVTYLDTLHPHGRRPFATIHFLAPTDRFYVPGLAQFLAPLNIQANITINQVNDRQTLINNPFFLFRPMALPQDPDGVLRITPGEGIPSPDPGGVVFPQWGQAPLADLTILNNVLNFADRIGTSPMTGGNMPSNAPRTARGTLALISEGNLKVDILIAMAQKEGFEELLQQLFGLYSTFMADEKYFYVTGSDRKRYPEMISRQLMRGKCQFRFRGNTVNTNPEVQRTLAQIRYQAAVLNPLYMQDPVKMRELLRDFLTAHSDGTSVERILPDLPGQGAEPHAPMSQADEITSMRMHRPVSVLWSDNHLAHAGELDAFSRSPYFEELDEVAVALIAQHRADHQQAAARQQQMAALQGPGGAGGVAQVPQGRQMADLGLGNLEGGTQ